MCPVHLPALWIFLLLILPGRAEAQGPVRAMTAQQARKVLALTREAERVIALNTHEVVEAQAQMM